VAAAAATEIIVAHEISAADQAAADQEAQHHLMPDQEHLVKVIMVAPELFGVVAAAVAQAVPVVLDLIL
jgi:hypothetical protein